MFSVESVRPKVADKGIRLFVSTLAVLLLPPFIAAAIVPLALLLFPVAWLAIPFIVTTLLGDAVSGAQAKPVPSRTETGKLAPAAFSGAR